MLPRTMKTKKKVEFISVIYALRAEMTSSDIQLVFLHFWKGISHITE